MIFVGNVRDAVSVRYEIRTQQRIVCARAAKRKAFTSLFKELIRIGGSELKTAAIIISATALPGCSDEY